MPFIGKDSRGPGNFWVRTSSGWQKVSCLRENLNRHIKRIARERILTNSKPSFTQKNDSKDVPSTSKTGILSSKTGGNLSKVNKMKYVERPEAHYIFIPSTLVNGGYLTVGEVLCKLDFVTALNDPRRFSYVMKFMELIVEHQFVGLSGTAFKCLFYVFEEAVNIVMSINRDIGRVKKLLEKTKQKIIDNRYLLVGSAAIYNVRIQVLTMWISQLEDHPLPEREEDGKPTLDTLPLPCKRLILRMLTDPADIERLGQTNYLFHRLSEDPLLWEELFHYHYSEATVRKIFPEFVPMDNTDWKQMMKKMKKRAPLREEYADMLQKCCHCNCFYWKDGGHPCSIETLLERPDPRDEERKAVSIDISPTQLLAMFPSPK